MNFVESLPTTYCWSVMLSWRYSWRHLWRTVITSYTVVIRPLASYRPCYTYGEGRQGGLDSLGVKVSESACLLEIPQNTSAWRPFSKMAAISISRHQWTTNYVGI